MFYSSLYTLLATTHPASVPPENHVIPLKSPNPTPSQRLVPKLDTQLEIEEIKRHESVDNISLELVFFGNAPPPTQPTISPWNQSEALSYKKTSLSKKDFARMLLLSFRR